STFAVAAEVSSPEKMAQAPDGKILVAGYLNSGHGYGIVRLRDDGSLDGTFTASLPNDEGFPYVDALAVQPDGKVLYGGTFSSVEGTSRNGLARLNQNGTLDQ